MSLNDQIRKYILKFTYSDCYGSGFLIKPKEDSNTCYAFTAHHVLGKDFEYSKQKNNLTLKYKPTTATEISLKHTRCLFSSEKYDLVILSIDKEDVNNYLSDLNPIEVFNDNFIDCSTFGYPGIRSLHPTSETVAYEAVYNHENVESDDNYEIRTKTILSCHEYSQYTNINGLSGAGVFTEVNDKAYLTGLVLKSQNQQFITCLDLRSILAEINKKLPHPITAGGFSYTQTLKLDESDLSTIKDNIPDKLKMIKKIKNCGGASEQLEYLKSQGEFDKELTDRFSKLDKEIEELSITYLYKGILLHENKENQKATPAFKKAYKYYGDFKKYAAKAQLQQKKNTTSLNTPISTENDQKKQQNSHEVLLKESSSDDESLEHLKELLPNYQQQNNLPKIEESFLHCLAIYGKDKTKYAKEYLETMYQLGNLFCEKKEYDHAESYFINISDDKVEEHHSLKLQAIKKLHQLYFKVAQTYDDAEYDLKIKALQKSEKTFTPETLELQGKTYKELALLFSKKRNPSVTNKYLYLALNAYQRFNPKEDYLKDIIWIYVALSKVSVCLDKRNHLKHLSFFKQALCEIEYLDKTSHKYQQHKKSIKQHERNFYNNILQKEYEKHQKLFAQEKIFSMQQEQELQRNQLNHISEQTTLFNQDIQESQQSLLEKQITMQNDTEQMFRELRIQINVMNSNLQEMKQHTFSTRQGDQGMRLYSLMKNIYLKYKKAFENKWKTL